MLVISLFTFLLLLNLTSGQSRQIIERYNWIYPDFNWTNAPTTRENAILTGQYNPPSTAISAIRVFNGTIYVALPRMKIGNPVTLATIPNNSTEISPLLNPFPSWEMNKVGDCNGFQYVHGMEIDPNGTMWIADNGKTNTFQSYIGSPDCLPRLVRIDLKAINGSNTPPDKYILSSYYFPSDVVSHSTPLLSNMVLDQTKKGTYVYLTNVDIWDTCIVVYYFEENRSWKLTDPGTMGINVFDGFFYYGDNTATVMPWGANGLALSSMNDGDGNRTMCYTSMSTHYFNCFKTEIAQNENGPIGSYLTRYGPNLAQSENIAYDNNNNMYMTDSANAQIRVWNTNSTFAETPFVQDSRLNYPDSFTVDDNGNAWFITDSIVKFYWGSISSTEPNYRIFYTPLGALGYQYNRSFNNDIDPKNPLNFSVLPLINKG